MESISQASPSWSSLTSSLRSSLSPSGLDLVAPLSLSWYNSSAPPSASLPPSGAFGSSALVLLVGNTAALWPAFLRAHDKDPCVGEADDPLDSYVSGSISGALLGWERLAPRVFLEHGVLEGGGRIAIQRMASAAGLAHLDEGCRLAVHPTYGPWIALRAAVVFDGVRGPGERPAEPEDPFEGEGGKRRRVDEAFKEAVGGGDDEGQRWRRWVKVRDAFSEGKHPHRYCDEQVLYHYDCPGERLRIRDGMRGYRKKLS